MIFLIKNKVILIVIKISDLNQANLIGQPWQVPAGNLESYDKTTTWDDAPAEGRHLSAGIKLQNIAIHPAWLNRWAPKQGGVDQYF